ncbi:MAG: hypothetical protein ACYDCJ_01625 [Gammaproteobacteria bacterium]
MKKLKHATELVHEAIAALGIHASRSMHTSLYIIAGEKHANKHDAAIFEPSK